MSSRRRRAAQHTAPVPTLTALELHAMERVMAAPPPDTASSDDFTVVVSMPSGKRTTLRVPRAARVSTLKQRIAAAGGTPVGQQALYFNGHELPDDSKLLHDEIGVNDGDIVDLAWSLPRH